MNTFNIVLNVRSEVSSITNHCRLSARLSERISLHICRNVSPSARFNSQHIGVEWGGGGSPWLSFSGGGEIPALKILPS